MSGGRQRAKRLGPGGRRLDAGPEAMSRADVIALFALAVALITAYFGYPVWRESRRRALLRLAIHVGQSSDAVETEVVQNGNRHQVVFGLILHNDGNREA